MREPHLSGLGRRSVIGCCENGNEALGCTEGGKLLIITWRMYAINQHYRTLASFFFKVVIAG
jgi:hypothetical protein